MTEPSRSHRLDGIEPESFLAILALLGAVRALEAADGHQPAERRWNPRISWDFDRPPLRPRLHLAVMADSEAVVSRIDGGLSTLARAYTFDGRKDVDFSVPDARRLLIEAAQSAAPQDRHRVDLVTAVLSDAATRPNQPQIVEPSPLCLLRGGGHQYFLDRLARVHAAYASGDAAERRGAVHRALFAPWTRSDELSSSFRWDPKEWVQYALMAGNPTLPPYKAGTESGANLLAAIGFAGFPVVPQRHRGRRRPVAVGCRWNREPEVAWPIWRHPATLPAVQSLLAHPDLYQPGGLAHLGVELVYVAHRIPGQLMNMSRGELLPA